MKPLIQYIVDCSHSSPSTKQIVHIIVQGTTILPVDSCIISSFTRNMKNTKKESNFRFMVEMVIVSEKMFNAHSAWGPPHKADHSHIFQVAWINLSVALTSHLLYEHISNKPLTLCHSRNKKSGEYPNLLGLEGVRKTEMFGYVKYDNIIMLAQVCGANCTWSELQR